MNKREDGGRNVPMPMDVTMNQIQSFGVDGVPEWMEIQTSKQDRIRHIAMKVTENETTDKFLATLQ